MTGDIRARRVTWSGILFDSILESDWAASMTAWGVEWRHHPGQLHLSDGRVYEPDFVLPGGGHWGEDLLLEVKGGHDLNLDKAQLAQADHPTMQVVVGRAPFVASYDVGEYGAASWEPAGYQWEIRGERFLSGELVEESGLPGLKMYRAVHNTSKID